ncbi:conserved Plasmodium protein, unknown function [Plasmodium berghei]|uniref:Uncharacterized protein n=2 Tax=Plasmodium berghei TaxID=5821 RepID=A0A509AT39_PLABA|nr:conserved Plasmodium protein, unknown function [Plasmodium berghei ANKA]CXJ29205.1 conserved Plasmodium protein, unknown function [Plasmodium berghei]SCM27074.1 conserved Plasmodium protein, unknown function [Plasmodium berghei]SCN28800.1 conserved Plasmodium protein, unknown function [Plasmodium berghei]SCO63092.1 conserved Plasmodium protein, unknown function [Plasmodium berghei]SCO64547.1 conserved Plasmodium protein, unknown function [Plasmodium berghei]|eukprot:XP_034424446.1 conserved Plasmodium protein, unknown function [Plasmodium berghei ANKA]
MHKNKLTHNHMNIDICIYPYIDSHIYIFKMNRQIIKLITEGKISEKKNINNQLIKHSLEEIIIDFKKYNKSKSENNLLNNIIRYTKIVTISSYHLNHMYKNIIHPLLKNKQLHFTLIPNIVHTYKKKKEYNFILKEINEYIIYNIIKKNIYTHDNLNNWISILQVFSSKYNNINYIPLLKFILFPQYYDKNIVIKQTNPIDIHKKGNNENITHSLMPLQYNNCTRNKQNDDILLLNNLDYKIFDILVPRNFCILINILSKVDLQYSNVNFSVPSSFSFFFYNSYIYNKIVNMLPQFNNIDLCLIIDSLHKFKYSNNNYLFKCIEKEVFKRINTFDIYQISIIFQKLSKYWNYCSIDDHKKMEHFFITFIKNIQKYIFHYLLNNKKKNKYILYTENKHSLIQIVPMFFLAYVKNVPFFFPCYITFSKFLNLQLFLLAKYVILLKNNHTKNCASASPNCNVIQNNNILNTELDDIKHISSHLENMNQTISNLIYSITGYLYNILTLCKKNEENKIVLTHFSLTLVNIYKLIDYFNFFYNNRKIISLKEHNTFIIPLHKSQLLTFIYIYWDFIIKLFYYLNNIQPTENNIYNSLLTDYESFYHINKVTPQNDFFYYIKLKYIKKIFQMITTLDTVNSNTIMKESLKRNNMHIAHIYSDILNIINEKKLTSPNYFFNRQIIASYTISVLCRSN